jgi:vancomycin aglycone glucosyltransferase
MRIALAAEGSRGDVQPMVALAARLIERGQEAVVCAPPDLRPFVEERGVEFRPLGTDIHRFLAENADALRRGPVVATRLGSDCSGGS